MPSYTLAIEAVGLYSSDIPTLEIWEDGVLDSSHLISSTGSSIILTINYPGTLPSSLEFRFNDGLAEGGRTIEIQSVKINDKYVNVGNYLSQDSLTNGGAAGVVDVPNSSFLFDASEPGAGIFTPATQTFTAGNDSYRDNTGVADTFDMLGGRDVARLGDGNDTVSGGAGNDYLRGGGGDDLLYGAADNDRLFGEDGDDTLYGGTGNDFIFGGNDNDEIHGNDGDDRLHGQAGDDVITGGIGNDIITGGSGTNFLFGDAGNDQIMGDSGVDTIDGGDDNDILYGGGGGDIINGGDGLDIIVGDAGDDILSGDDGDDELYGRADDDILRGGAGADELHGEGGVDIVDGGTGNDTINLANGDFAAGESLTGGANTDNITLTNATTVDFTTGTLATIEILNGSTGNDDVTIGAAELVDFTTVDLAGGTDILSVSADGTNDISALTLPTISNVETGNLVGSAGADDLTLTGAQLDAIIEGAGTIDFGGGSDILSITSTSADLNDLGINNNASLTNLEEIDASSAGAGVIISVSGQTEAFILTGGTSADTLIGGSAGDTIDGGDGDNILTGLGGDDVITGGTGNDTILGGDGDDIIVGGDGDDTIYGATIIGESGVETVVQTDSSTWHTVTFAATISNPVVKMSNMTNNDGDFYVVRVRDVTETGFEWQIDEFDYLDGSRVLAEDVSWIAISAGTHTLDNGLVVQAGMTTATNEAFTTITYDSAFGSAPVVMTQVMSDNDGAAVGTRNRNRTATNFQVQMLEEEIADGTHATEDIGWIAIDNGGAVGTGFLVAETGNSVNHNVTTVNFGSAFDNTPVVLHDQQTRDGGDTSYSQADGVTTSTARFFVGEEQSRDAEVNHTSEVIGYYALNEGLLTSENGGDNTLTGGAGLDTLYGGDGLDTFIFEAASAFADLDVLADFSTGEGDVLDISDLIIGAFSGTITDYVFFDDSSGTDTVVQVDRDGTAGGFALQDITLINGITGLDEATLFTNGNIVV